MQDTYRVTIGTYYRLLLPDLLPKMSKVLYFDCDIIFDLDVQELWNVDVKDYCMAGALDMNLVRYNNGADEFVRDFLMGCNFHTYVNAGVLVMNLNMIRKRGNLFQDAMNWLNTHVHLMQLSDQDIINCLFYKSIKIIDHRFNNMCPIIEQETLNSIIHASGFNRAWEITGMPYQKMYWKTYLISEWGRNKSPEEVIDAITSYAPKRTISKKLPLYKRILLKIQTRKSIKIITYISKYVFYKLKYTISSPC